MTRVLHLCVTVCAIIDLGYGLSSKTDFGEDENTSVVTNTTNVDEDVEVKHTIVVSTKLKNNNRKGFINSDGEQGALTYNIGRTYNSKKEDSGEVPVGVGYKAVETTQIRTPDSRYKPKIYPESVFINRNIPDEYDIYPNIAINPAQWKPSTFFNNVNWWNQDDSSFRRRNDRPIYQNPTQLHRKITDDGMKEFYCRKCRELSHGQGTRGCVQQRSNGWAYATTTPKIKLDGKLAKLN